MRQFLILMSVFFFSCSSRDSVKLADDLKPYESVLESVNLDSCYYAMVDLGVPTLLLTDYIYTDDNGVDASIVARIYSLDTSGKVLDHGELRTQGTSYPFTYSNGSLYRAGHHFIEKYCVRDGELICVENGLEKFEDGGKKSILWYQKGCEEMIQCDSLYEYISEEWFTSPVVAFIKIH